MVARALASACVAVALAISSAPTVSGASYNHHPVAKRLNENTIAPRASNSKYVFAHVVQGDFQQYEAADWTADIALAKAAGIDAFALNVGADSTDSAQMKLAFDAANTDGTFKLFFSFDGSKFNTNATASAILPTYLTPFALQSSYFTYDGKSFVSTFAGDATGTFLGNTTSLAATDALSSSLPVRLVSLIPGFAAADFPSPHSPPDWNSPDDVQYAGLGGIMGWNAWPTTDANMTTDSDSAYITAASGRGLTYTATVSPFFYVHVATDNNYLYRSDDWLLPTHYEQLINLSAGPDMIELLTWNDFGESHYLGPIRDNAAPPTGSGNYTKGFDHTPMLTLSSYYNTWYKSGTAPTIGSETIVWWYRPHPKSATASADSLPAPSNVDWTDDYIYAAVLIPAKSKATHILFYSGDSAPSTQTVSSGVNLLRAPFVAGNTGLTLVDKKGNTILAGNGTAIISNPATYNFNYYSYILPANGTPASITAASTTTKSASMRLSASSGLTLAGVAVSALITLL
ncbi:hypothetical protein RQP46_005336 [Phenoliferia psychrophenolica]